MCGTHFAIETNLKKCPNQPKFTLYEVSPPPQVSVPSVFELLNREDKHDRQLRGFHLSQTDIFSHRWQVVYQHRGGVFVCALF